MSEFFRALSILVISAFAFAPAVAQQDVYPSKPVKLVVPFPPGGPADVIGRSIAERLSATLGKPVIVENRGGAAGNVGTEFVARSAPDGYVLLVGTSGMVANVALFANLQYDPEKDFAPVTLIGEVPTLVVAHPSFPPNSVGELVTYAKANPGKVNYGTSGAGVTGHLVIAMMGTANGLDLVHVPYKGAGPAVTDVVAGHVNMASAGVIVMLPHVKSGRLKPIALGARKRSSLMPEVPTIGESLPGDHIATWYAIMAPAGTPKPIIEKLHQEIVAAVQTPAVEKRFRDGGLELIMANPEEFAEVIRREIPMYARIIKQIGVKAD